MRDRRQGKPVLALSQLLLDLVSNKTLLKRKNTIQSRAFNSNGKKDENVESISFISYLKRAEKSLGKSFSVLIVLQGEL